MPTLQEIFYNMNGEEVSSPDLEDEMRALCGFARLLKEQKKIKKIDKNRLCESAEAVSRTAKCAGFALGFSVAVRLFCQRD
ncbi:MAG: hypothetical protein K2H90_03900 [Oscillospiraceae bacterium]|nr:hypothetical protein [Oscillospiraceae bacterium]